MFQINQNQIGDGQPCFIIAEAGVNHNGNADWAFQLIDIAVEAKVDAVKFQTALAEDLVIADAPKAEYQKQAADDDTSQLEMIKKLVLPFPLFIELQKYTEDKGLIFMSSPFEEKSADFLVDVLKVPALKVPSGELTNLPFLAHISKKGVPMIVSTGMATLDEVRVAVEVIRKNGNPPLSLLHCTSSYPAPYDTINLKAMETLSKTFDVPVGYSDHTEGILIPVVAVAMGACIIEKHYTIDRTLPGPDHKASLSPSELKEMVHAIRSVESAMGTGEKIPNPIEKNVTMVARKSLVSARLLQKGTIFTEDCAVARRPGTGISPSELNHLIGKRIIRDIPPMTMLRREDFE